MYLCTTFNIFLVAWQVSGYSHNSPYSNRLSHYIKCSNMYASKTSKTAPSTDFPTCSYHLDKHRYATNKMDDSCHRHYYAQPIVPHPESMDFYRTDEFNPSCHHHRDYKYNKNHCADARQAPLLEVIKKCLPELCPMQTYTNSH